MTTTPTAAAVCECARCRAHRAGLGPGPYDPRQYAAIAPPVVAPAIDDPLAADPGVAAAERELDEARAVVDAAHGLWLEAVARHRSAQLRDDPYLRNADGDIVGLRPLQADAGRVAELAEAELEARERRDVAQQVFVRAHDSLRRAQWRAQVGAARDGGRNGKRKGR